MTAMIDRVLRLVEWVVIGLMAAVALTVFAEVALRGLADRSLIVADEAARYAMIWIAMLGSALLVAEDGHIRMAILPALLPPPMQRLLDAVAQLLVFAFLAVLFGASLSILPEVSRDRTVTLGITMDLVYAALPVGAFLMMVLTLRNLARIFRRDRGPAPASPVSRAEP